jgi:hypothetical protein
MERVMRARLIGGMLLSIFMVGGAWYFSRCDSLACNLSIGEPDQGSKLNLYRPCLVNGVSGVAQFLQAMPDSPVSYDTCWQRALDWIWAMRYKFPVSEGEYYRWAEFQGDNEDTAVVRQQSGIGRAFIDAFAALPGSTKYRDRAKEPALYLMLHYEGIPQYIVMQDSTHGTFGDMVFWQRKDIAGTPDG